MSDMKKVLVVDDNQAAADSLVKLFRALQWDAEALYSGQALLDHLRSEVPAIVFVDIGMPDMNGYETIIAVRAEGYQMPAVALTGYGQADDKDKAIEAGFTAHLTKPVGVDEFRAVLAELVG